MKILNKAGFNSLKKGIAESEEKRDELRKYIGELQKKYSSGEISYSFYIETLYKKFEGKDILEWIEQFDEHIKDCRKRMKEERGALLLKQVSILALFLAILAFAIKYILL